MSTEIIKIDGTCHEESRETHKTVHKPAELYLTRFYNGEEKGSSMQLTISASNSYGTSYIHLTKEQCSELANALAEGFNYTKYPSD